MATCQKKVWKHNALIWVWINNNTQLVDYTSLSQFQLTFCTESIVLLTGSAALSKDHEAEFKTGLTVFQKNTRLTSLCNAWMVLCEAATQHYMNKCFCGNQVPSLSQSGREGVPNDRQGGIGHTHTNIQWPMGTGQFLLLNVSILLERHHWIFVWQDVLGEEEKHNVQTKRAKNKQGWRGYNTVSWEHVFKTVSRASLGWDSGTGGQSQWVAKFSSLLANPE